MSSFFVMSDDYFHAHECIIIFYLQCFYRSPHILIRLNQFGTFCIEIKFVQCPDFFMSDDYVYYAHKRITIFYLHFYY